jgi:hypothetical protein
MTAEAAVLHKMRVAFVSNVIHRALAPSNAARSAAINRQPTTRGNAAQLKIR